MGRKHIFDIEIAKEYGVNVAIILENMDFWISKNKANNKHFYEGRYWTYNSVRAFHELFPYLSEKQIYTTLNKMVDEGLIMVGNFNKLPYDRTKWYALTDKGESILQNGKMGVTEKENEIAEKVEPIPYINTDINSDINTDNDIYSPTAPEENGKDKKSESKPKPIRHKYGEYKHVLLTDEQLEKLNNEYGVEFTQRCITYLDEYIEMKGYKAKNHYLCIKKWVHDAVKKNGNRNSYYNNAKDKDEKFYGLENTAENDISGWWGK